MNGGLWAGSRELVDHGELWGEVVALVLDQMSDRTEEAAAAGLHIVGPLAFDDKFVLPSDAPTLEALWRLAVAAIPGARGQSHAWGRVVRRLSKADLRRAVELCCRASVEGDLSIQEEARNELSAFIGMDAPMCLEILGPMLLSIEPWMLGVGERGSFMTSFPPELLEQWVEDHGVPAARVLAPCLPLPYCAGDGSLVVPRLTEYVLSKFEDDDDVYEAFAYGRHDTRVYSGDIAGLHDAEASNAAKFQSHRLRRIRQWAAERAASSRREATWWREREEDFDA